MYDCGYCCWYSLFAIIIVEVTRCSCLTTYCEIEEGLFSVFLAWVVTGHLWHQPFGKPRFLQPFRCFTRLTLIVIYIWSDQTLCHCYSMHLSRFMGASKWQTTTTTSAGPTTGPTTTCLWPRPKLGVTSYVQGV